MAAGKYRVATGIVVCAILSGCAPGVMINPAYSEKDMRGKPLHIALVGKTKIEYDGSMDNEFSKQGRYGNIRTFICSTAAKTVKESSTFGSVDMNPIECKSFSLKKLKWDARSDPFIMQLPDDTCNNGSDSQSIWLFLEQTSVTSHPWVQLIMINFIPIGAIPHKPLTIAGKFVYWDAAGKKPIAWGLASGTYDQGPGVTMTNWQAAAYDFAVKLVKETPFDRTPDPRKKKRK